MSDRPELRIAPPDHAGLDRRAGGASRALRLQRSTSGGGDPTARCLSGEDFGTMLIDPGQLRESSVKIQRGLLRRDGRARRGEPSHYYSAAAA